MLTVCRAVILPKENKSDEYNVLMTSLLGLDCFVVRLDGISWDFERATEDDGVWSLGS